MRLAECLKRALSRYVSLEYKLTWKQWDIGSEPPICALLAVGLRRKGKDYSGWPTAQAHDGQHAPRSEASAKKKGSRDLQREAVFTPWPAPWNAPRATDASHGGPNQTGGGTPSRRGEGQRERERVHGLGLSDSEGQSLRARERGHDGSQSQPEGGQAPLASGPWSDFFPVHLTDGTVRRVGRGVFPVAPRVFGRMGAPGSRLRALAKDARAYRAGCLKGSGNSIIPILGAEFILAYREAQEDIAVKARTTLEAA